MSDEQLVEVNKDSYGLGYRHTPHGPLRRFFRSTVHYLSWNFILKSRSTRTVKASGFRLTVRPTVFHPKLFLTSEFFAKFLGTMDLRGKRCVDIGTGSGILALAAARAGSTDVFAIDINPNAAKTASENAHANGLGERVTAVCSNLLSALSTEHKFDVIISNPPFFPGEPRDVADRAWVAGPEYRDIISLFEQARARLSPTGVMYVLLSSDCDLKLLGELIAKAGFRARIVTKWSILVEVMIIYELTPV